MFRTTLITLGAIVAAIALGTVVWNRATESPSPNRTPNLFVPPTTDPMTAAAEYAAWQACREDVLAYDPRTSTPDLTGCDFDRLGGARAIASFAWRDFTGANFSHAYLAGNNFIRANFTDANFAGAQLSAGWGPSDFNSANFTGANLTNARLPRANLDEANFTNADLRGAYFYELAIVGGIISWASYTDVIWANTTCPDGTNSDANGGTCADNLYVDPSHRPSPTPTATTAP